VGLAIAGRGGVKPRLHVAPRIANSLLRRRVDHRANRRHAPNLMLSADARPAVAATGLLSRLATRAVVGTTSTNAIRQVRAPSHGGETGPNDYGSLPPKARQRRPHVVVTASVNSVDWARGVVGAAELACPLRVRDQRMSGVVTESAEVSRRPLMMNTRVVAVRGQPLDGLMLDGVHQAAECAATDRRKHWLHPGSTEAQGRPEPLYVLVESVCHRARRAARQVLSCSRCP
jgi:hypothetical protein